MLDWNAENPRSWARTQGLVHLPLFPARSNSPEREHAVLLDGEKTGIAFTFGDPDKLLKSKKAYSWSWSSNLTHTFVIDKPNRQLHIGRWDQPDEFESHPLPTENRAANLLNSISASDPPHGQTVVRRMISLFRIIRQHITDRGGNPIDVVHAFNGVIAFAGFIRGTVGQSVTQISPMTLGECLASITTSPYPKVLPKRTSNIVAEFPVRDLIEGLIERDADTDYYLDPNLLIRHAAGALFQETRVELARRTFFQRQLFDSISLELAPTKGKLRCDVHFTPPSLARTLVEQTISAIRKMRSLPEQLEILDPACGSGVFLIEALRELGFGDEQSLKLIGIEESDVSCEMARFCLDQALHDGTAHSLLSTSVEITTKDSLAEDCSWGEPDIILMNPPFVPWRSMSVPDRKQTALTLGELYSGHADKALAFLWKAIKSLKPGAALGTIIPAPMLEGVSGTKLRERVGADQSLSIVLLGRFQDYGYFEGAAVEPAFLVIARNLTSMAREPVRVVLTTRETEGRAFRELRREHFSNSNAQQGWEVFTARHEDFTSISWMPRARAITSAIESLTLAGVPTVKDLFDVHLGIRTGWNAVFQLSASQLRAMRPTATEREFFKPVVDNDSIRDARIKSNRYVFYPYGVDGKLLITSEDALKAVVPEYYRSYLFPNRSKLQKRRSIRERKWWELSEPRLSWQPNRAPKIVSPCFGRSGRFAYDTSGRYCVVQGFAWIWKVESLNDDYLAWAYLAILNSDVFDSFLRFFCPKVRAGQCSLYPHHVGRVFLPDLSDTSKIPSDLTDELSRLGRRLAKEGGANLNEIDSAANRAYTACTLNNPLSFLFSELYPMSQLGQLDAAIDRVIGFVEDTLGRGDLNLCENAMRAIEVEKLEPSVLLAILSMTVVAKHNLPGRAAFCGRVRQLLLRSKSEKEVRQLLKGLE